MSAPLREARVSISAIAHNIRRVRALAGGPRVIAVVKADGYGHGALIAAGAALAGGADALGVADTGEALALRAAGVTAPILAWLHAADADFGPAVAAGVELGVSSLDQLRRVAATGPGAVVHLKADTGLSRNGVAPEEWADVVTLAARLERDGTVRVAGLMSHLANTSEAEDAAQAAAFSAAVDAARAGGLRPDHVHLSATAGALRRPQTGCDTIRVGIGAYGLSPVEGATSADLGLIPAMTLVSSVAAVRRIPAGAAVSYGSTWRAPAPTNLALVPVGYADGLPRAASGRAEVTIGGTRFPVRGRIAMDQVVVDVGDTAVALGDPVVLFGDPATGVPGAADWAGWAGTIDYEIVTRIGSRVVRTAA